MAIDQVTTGLIKDDAVTADKIVAGAVVADIAAGGVTTAKLAADAVDGTKLADNAVNSEHVTNGSIDLAHLSADSVDGTKIVDNAIDSEHYTDGSIDTAHIGNLQVTAAKVASDVATTGGTQTLTNKTLTSPAIITSPNSYGFIGNAELNSLGILKHTFLGTTRVLNANLSPSGSTWTQLTGWNKMNDASTGAANADPFARFLSNEWYPTIAGYYFAQLTVMINASDNVAMYCQIRRSVDGGGTGESTEGTNLSQRSSGQSTYQSVSVSGILPCDANDKLEFWAKVDQSGRTIYKSGTSGRLSSLSIAYLGSSTL